MKSVKKLISIIASISTLFVLHSCHKQVPLEKDDRTMNKPWITVWVPGTHPDHLPPLNVFSFIDKYKQITYGPDWVKISEFNPKYYNYTIAKTLCDIAPQQFDLNNFYLGGWSGALDFEERAQTAQKFYNHFKEIVADYKKTHGDLPKIRVITHSHGGNVVLNMAQYKKPEDNVILDELVLLGCPVQKATSHFLKDSMFKKIYSIHSHLDMIQMLDPQGWQGIKTQIKEFFGGNGSLDTIKKIFSIFGNRTFFSERHFEPQENLTQVRIKSNDRGIMHIEFIMPHFIKKLPGLLKTLNESPKENFKVFGNDIIINLKKITPPKKNPRRNRRGKRLKQ